MEPSSLWSVNTRPQGNIVPKKSCTDEQFISLAVTADEDFDPARVIQDTRRICTERAVYKDTVAEHRKTFAFLKALPDEHYKAFKTGLRCAAKLPLEALGASCRLTTSPTGPTRSIPCIFALKLEVYLW